SKRVNLGTTEGQAKVGGTVICVSGAIVMVLFHGPALFGGSNQDFVTQTEISERGQLAPAGWLVVLCVIGNCMCMASLLAFQEYPASLSVTAYSYFFGAIFIVITTFFMANESTDWSLTESELSAVIYTGAVASAFNHGFMTWSNRILKPALVALYNPIQLVASAILSIFFLGSPIY
ncbi:hypothetical protein CICLE_v10013379mg, partial [Citrus x clementina]